MIPDRAFEKVTHLIERPFIFVLTWVTANVAALIAILGFFGVSASYDWLKPALSIVATILFGFGCWCAYSVYHENKRLKACIHELHQINHLYRDAISNRFFDDGINEKLEDGQLVEQEKGTLNHVCSKIASIFRFLTNRKCFVAVYMIRKQKNKSVCSIHAYSEYEASRSKTPPETFTIDSENTRFWEANVKRPSCINFFHSADLQKLQDYNDQTKHFEAQYKSCIVVPIRYCPNRLNAEPDDLGYLVVDTLTCDRLNGGFHVHYLAAFADQMYNFQNIWRMEKVEK